VGKLGSCSGRELAIDLGTANTLVFVPGRGVVGFEPSVVAIDDETGRVPAVGEEIAGGDALLAGIDECVAAETGVHVSVAEGALECVVLGAGSALEERDTLDRAARRRSRASLFPRRRRRR